MTVRTGSASRVARRPVTARAAGASRRHFALLVAVAAALLVAGSTLGLAFGSHDVPLGTVVRALTTYDPSDQHHVIVVASRVPRTVLAVVVGAALGLSGALLQAVTRNPLAEPGLFGVNAGAASAVVVGIAVFGVVDVRGHIGFAFLGAAVSSIVVYALGVARRGATTPARMALAGVAVTMVLVAVTDMVLLSDEQVFHQYRFWAVGTLQGRGLDVAAVAAPFVLAGAVVALLLSGPLNALALGDDTARGLGARPEVARAVAAAVAVLLAGAATVAAGPIAFVGLAAPHVVRAVVGHDNRFVIAGVLVTGPAFLLVADVAGRWVVAPGELHTSVAAAVFGAPIFLALVRSRRLRGLR